MILFVDASSLVKRYHEEVGSDTMDALFRPRDPEREFYISDHIGLEVFVRLGKLSRTGPGRARKSLRHRLRRFTSERADYFNIVKVDVHLVSEAEVLAARFADSGAGTLDLIHLASALQVQRNAPNEPLVFVASDRKLKHVATRAGFHHVRSRAGTRRGSRTLTP
ncbi:MAG TPA: type II toxin-antitoxin system VapC family toxin, partial [Longimicrobium sp.]